MKPEALCAETNLTVTCIYVHTYMDAPCLVPVYGARVCAVHVLVHTYILGAHMIMTFASVYFFAHSMPHVDTCVCG
jgi:hypothetical protein